MQTWMIGAVSNEGTTNSETEGKELGMGEGYLAEGLTCVQALGRPVVCFSAQ